LEYNGYGAIQTLFSSGVKSWGKGVAMTRNMIFIALILIFAGAALAGLGEDALLTQAKEYFAPLPKAMASVKNPLTPEKTALGKMLFYETRISVDGTVSCARCHPVGLYAADGLKKSVGNNCRVNPRNAPTVLNAAGQISEHWTGNRTDVEDQAKQALIGPPSFGMPSYQAAEEKLKGIKGYTPLFKKAFPGEKDPVNVDNFAQAIGAFERTLVTPSRFDAFLNGDPAALTSAQKSGLKAFLENGCAACHSGPYLGGQAYQEFGLYEPYWQYTKSREVDEGRYAVTKNEGDKYVFKVASLRNVKMTSPYFHDGSVDRLHDAVWIMGKVQSARNLGDDQIEVIIFFLESLTGPIPDDLLRMPLLPPTE
jgi:cytochrome c peroxidase